MFRVKINNSVRISYKYKAMHGWTCSFLQSLVNESLYGLTVAEGIDNYHSNPYEMMNDSNSI